MDRLTRELVVLLDEDHRHVGVADKATVHTEQTPLHLAFSCHVLDARGRVLVTRRALGKRTWPGVWTNSCCGHPGPDETPEAAVRRRVRQELGLDLTDVWPALPDFRYRAVSAEGIVENEVCPVFWARTDGEPDPDPEEVAEYAWVEWNDLVAAAEHAPWALSPWSVLQIPAMPRP
ncbi:isopentenyl-diphosphate Delta-isomerase [Nocardiopsis sp. HNM0947]|uniref:Isopentenyl-diphosphate Delta-isomerase n=1 Tax=Nocardiopsis coralli TaxID=2772213 RepID=A0ABR9P2D1_9ACTN|nr:isopentenyl-diphosphate Delta-isomerase [Nocardiopsis coralli]MBE2997999.1 isopentenyl-diphosphate Delta-isomerase [Nocardiopsis coralli]